MEIKEIRCYDDLKLVNMFYQSKEFSYTILNGIEIFEIYYYNGKLEDGFHYSKSYKLSENQIPPKKYEKILRFLKEEFNKINWDVEMVKYKLTK